MSLIDRLRGVVPSIPAMRDAANYIEAIERDRDSARAGMIKRGETLARISLEADAIASALGERGFADFADDVRMLAKMASKD